jgi:hypothetical protein
LRREASVELQTSGLPKAALTANFAVLIPTGGIKTPSFGAPHDTRFQVTAGALATNG